jgi:hypothetical protein
MTCRLPDNGVGGDDTVDQIGGHCERRPVLQPNRDGDRATALAHQCPRVGRRTWRAPETGRLEPGGSDYRTQPSSELGELERRHRMSLLAGRYVHISTAISMTLGCDRHTGWVTVMAGEQIPLGPRLNPAQQQILDELGSTTRPTFRDDLRDHLRHELEVSIRPFADDYPDGTLFVSKRRLTMIHGCEARFVADEAEPFEWSIASARGTIAHKAIELLIGRRGTPTPLDLVHDALDRLEAEERSIGAFIAQLGEAERADLVSSVNDVVATFMDTFPPISRKWVPVSESRVRADLCDDSVVLQGAVDLSLGRARGNEAGKVLIDYKTGRPNMSHIEDLRFYALLETLKIGIPPRLVVSYYLEAGQPRTEAVTEELLWSTAMRVVDAVEKLVAVTQRPAQKSPGIGCRWCPIAADCDEGTAFLAELDDEDGVGANP